MLRKLHSRIAYANVISTLCLFVLLGGGAWAALAVPAAASAADGIYWANPGSGKIRVGNVNGGGTPADLFASTTESAPYGVAIEPAAGKIYWANNNSGKIRVGNLNGGGTPADLFSTTESYPQGVAIHPPAGEIYWAPNNSGEIRVGNLNGGGAPAGPLPPTAHGRPRRPAALPPPG